MTQGEAKFDTNMARSKQKLKVSLASHMDEGKFYKMQFNLLNPTNDRFHDVVYYEGILYEQVKEKEGEDTDGEGQEHTTEE
jgi:hypothetical protein